MPLVDHMSSPAAALSARWLRALAVLLLGLALTGLRPVLDGQPGKYVHVRWRAEVSDIERWWLEARFSLRKAQREGRSFGYDLLDRSPENVRALLGHSGVEDTASFDRVGLRVDPTAEDGHSRTGLAWRWHVEAVLPALRPLGLVLVFVGGVWLLHQSLSAPRFRSNVHERAVVPSRFLELDVLRGLAATAVLLFHLTARFGTYFGHPSRPFVVVPWGYYGVHLFFVVSGMVIFLTIERSRSSWDFVLARLGRLFPTYLVAVTLTWVAAVRFGLPDVPVSVRAYLWNLTMLQRFVGIADVDGVYWTLQVELAFYVLMLTMLACRAVPMVESILVGWLAVLSWNAAGDALMREGLETSRIQLVTLYGYAPLFIAGMALHLQRTRGLSVTRVAVLAGALGVFAWRSSTEAALVFLGIMAVVELAIYGYLARLTVRPLLVLGALSYPLYLVHQTLGYLLLRSLYRHGAPTNAGILLTITAVITLAAALHYVVEQPGQALARGLRTRLWAGTR